MRAAAAVLYAVCASVLLALALAFARGGLDPLSAAIALAGGTLLGLWSLRGKDAPHDTPPAPPNGWEFVTLAIFAAVSLRAFLWLVFIDGDKIKVLSPNNLGDLSLHLTYIRNLASGVAFWPDNPILAHSKLTYPVGVDLFNALLALAGLDVLRGLIWVGLAGAALTGVALWRWGRGVAVAAFLANGGLAGFAIFLTRAPADFQAELAWKSIFLSIFVTQRGLLFALPAGLLLLTSWRARFFDANDPERLPRWGEVLLYTSMPVFHLHTFIFLSMMLGSWFVLHPPARRELLRLVGIAAVPATALVLLVTGMMKGASVLGWKPGWMWDDPAWVKWCADFLPGSPRVNAAILFWPVNFGLLLPLVAALTWRLGKDSRATWPRALFFPALFAFLLCCFVKFAPWEWDNTKIMLWAYLAIVPLAWNELLEWRPLWQRAVAALVLFGSGFVSLVGGLDGTHRGHEIATRSELDGIASAISKIPVSERFAAYPTYNHPLLLLGRKVALGYTGHAWSHGLPWQEAAAQIDALMNGEDEWRVHAADLGVRYLHWGPAEEANYPRSTKPWREAAALVAHGTWGELYDLQARPAHDADLEIETTTTDTSPATVPQ